MDRVDLRALSLAERVERRALALAEITPKADVEAMVAALAVIEAMGVWGLELGFDAGARIAFCATHPDSAVRFAWARVGIAATYRNDALGQWLDRIWAWSEAALPEVRDPRRDAWARMASLPLRTRVESPLMEALLDDWHAADGDEARALLELINYLSHAVVLPDRAARLLRDEVADAAAPAVAARCVRLWCGLALAGWGQDREVIEQANAWWAEGVVPADSTPRLRLMQVIVRRGEVAEARALRAGGDAALDEDLARVVRPRLRGADSGAWVALLAEIAAQHGGGPAWEAVHSLSVAAARGADLSPVIPILRPVWATLSYHKGPWAEPPQMDDRSDVVKESAARDTLLFIMAGAEQSGDPLPGLAAEVEERFGSFLRGALEKRLLTLDRWFGPGAAARARARLGLAH